MAIENRTNQFSTREVKTEEVNRILDLEGHRAFLAGVYESQSHTVFVNDSKGYDWTGPLEDRRLEFQNNHPDIGWGQAHRDVHVTLRESGFNPSRIATIGVGKDATLVENLADIYDDSHIVVIEQDASKVEGAHTRIVNERPDLVSRVEFIQADAVSELKLHPGEFDMIDAQLLLQHMSKQGPPGTPTLGGLLEATTDALASGGRMTVADLEFDGWQIHPQEGQEDNEEVQRKIAESRRYIGMAKQLGWEARSATPFKNAEHIQETVEQMSGLVFERELGRVDFGAVDGEDPATDLIAYIIPTIATGMGNGVKRVEQIVQQMPEGSESRQQMEARLSNMKKGEDALWSEGKKYSEVIRHEGVVNSLPPLVTLSFRKA